MKKIHPIISLCLVFILFVCNFTFVIPVFASNNSNTTVINSKVDALVYDFEFLSTSVDGTIYKKPETLGWQVVNGASQTTEVEDSVWKIDVNSSEYAVQGEEDVAIEAKLYSSFRMKILNKTAAANATLYFKTDKDKTYSDSKSISINIQPNDKVYREYLFDMNQVDTWDGMINQVKIVFENALNDTTNVGKLNVDYFSFNPDSKPSNILFDFSETLGWVQNISNATQTGEDNLFLTPTGKNASFETVDNLGLDASQFNYFKIALQNTTSAKRMRVSFITTTSLIWNESKSVLLDDLKVSDSGLSYYAFNMTSCEHWKGKIKKLRVTFEDTKANDGNISIPVMGVFTGVILEDTVFDFTNNHYGWTSGLNTSLSQKDNALNIEINGADAYYTSPEVSINADEMRYITLKLKNSTASIGMRIQWQNEGDTEFNDIKSQNILITPNSEEKEYTVALGDHQRWEGNVTKLKITPALYSTKGSQQISSITFSQNEDTSFSGRAVTEGSISGGSGWSFNGNGGQFNGQMDKLGTVTVNNKGSGCAVEVSNNGPDSITYGKFLPAEAWSSVPKYTDGYIKWSVSINVSDVNAKGNTLKLINTETNKDSVRLFITNGELKAALPQGEKKISDIQSSKMLKFVMHMNMSNHTYDLWMNSELVERDIPFTKAESFDKIYIGTTGENKVVFGYTGNMYRVNELIETFSHTPADLTNSDEYKVSGDVSASGKLTVGNNEASSFEAEFTPKSNVVETNVRFSITQKEDETDNPSVSEGAVLIASNKLSEEQATWILGASGNGFTLKNKATGLYLTMENNNGTIKLYQAERKDASDTSQIFKFNSVGDGYYCIYHIALNKVIYSNTVGDNILFQSASNWWTAPSGADSYNKCKFELAKAPSDGMEITIKIAGNGAYIQSGEKADGMKLQLLNGTKEAAAIYISGDDIMYLDKEGNQKVLWKDFKTNVVYSLKIRTYTELNKVEYSINGCSSKNGGRENKNTPAESVILSDVKSVNKIAVSTNSQGIWNIEKIRILDYTPSTVPTIEAVNDTENGYVGVNAWLSNDDSVEKFYQKSQRIADKESVIGYYSDYSKDATDWQIKYLAENGIDFISYFFISYGEEAVDTYLDYADYKNKVNFAYQLINVCVTQQSEYESKLWPFLSERLFRNPNYIKYNNEPVLYVYSDLNGDIKLALSTLEGLAKQEGWNGITFVNVRNTANTAQFKEAKANGYDYVSNYWQVTTPSKADDAFVKAQAAGIDYIAAPGVGADSRCWSDLKLTDSTTYIHVTPSQFYNTLARCKENMTTYSSNSLASKMVFAENWSEFAEGHSIMPFGEFGFGYINQIRRVFGRTDDNNYKNTVPSGKLDGLFSKGWNKELLSNRGFETGVDNWSANDADLTTVNTTDFYYLKSAANVTNRKTANSLLEQDMTSTILKNGKGAVYDMSAYIKATSSTYTPNDDSIRYLSFFSFANTSLALTYVPSTGKMTLANYDENNENQRFLVKKVEDENYYQIYVADSYKEDKNGKVISGKIVINTGTWPNENEVKVYLMSPIKVWDISQINSENLTKTYFNIPKTIYDEDVIPIKMGPTASERNILQGPGTGQEVRSLIDWGDKNQRWVVKYRQPSEKPKSYVTGNSVVLEITDSTGVHEIGYYGGSPISETIQNGTQIKVDWNGELKKAVLKINGDTLTNEPFFVDECRFGLVPKMYYSMPQYVVVNDSVNKTGMIIVDRTMVSADSAIWILNTYGEGFILKNKATGLYMTVEKDENDVVSLYQSERTLDTTDNSQVFKFTPYGNYYFLVNVEYDKVLYSNTAGDAILFQDNSNWWIAPEGADSNNKCQFALDSAPADNMEITIRIAGSNAYLQNAEDIVVPDESVELKVDIIADKILSSEEQATWILNTYGEGFVLKNKATGLYMTMEKDSDNSLMLYQTERRSNTDTSQVFKFLSTGGSYYFLYNSALNAGIYSNISGDGILFKSASSWWIPPDGANHSNLCQFALSQVPADNNEIVIRFANSYTYLQSVKTDNVIISATAEPNGTVNSSTQKSVVGAKVTVLAIPNKGYVFDGWYKGTNKISDDAQYTFVAKENVNLVAKFSVNYGDADFDGNIGNTDMVVIRKGLMNDIEYIPQYDANKDGLFDICDLVKIKKILLDLV